MEPILIVLLAIGMVWLAIKAIQTKDELGSLNRHLSHLESEIYRLKQRLEEPRERGAKAAPAPAGPPAQPVPQLAAAPAPVEARPSPPPHAVPQPAAGPAAPETPPRLEPLPPETAPAPRPAPAFTAVERPVLPAIDWEQFMGVKLFAWLGGLALLLGVVFAIKYSFEKNLIPPAVRAAGGFLVGIGLLAGGVVLKRKEYATTSQTLCATGIAILYATSFACRAYYKFAFAENHPEVIFALMILVTVTAFLLAVKLDAMVIAILGLLGGFLTPPLLSTGEDQPLGLFSYIALLDAGLMAVAFKKRWHFLFLLGAAGTVAMQIGWAAKFFEVEKVFIAMAVFLGFGLLFLSGSALGKKLRQANPWLSAAAALLPFVTFGFTAYLNRFLSLGGRPGVLFAFIFISDLYLLALVLLQPQLHKLHLTGGLAVFFLLAGWTWQHATAELLDWGLAGYLAFTALHSVFPVVLQRLRPNLSPVWWGHLFPPLALLLVVFPLLNNRELTWLLWPCVLLIDAIAVGLAYLTASIIAILAVLVLTAAVTAIWIFKIPAQLTGLPPILFVVGGFALFFFFISLYLGRKILASLQAAGAAAKPGETTGDKPASGLVKANELALLQIPAFSAILPFLLLMLATARLPLANPSPVFGLGLFMAALLLGLARASKLDALAPVALICVLALEHSWHGLHFAPAEALIPLLWYVAFAAVFGLFPFLFMKAFSERIVPWAAAALSAPLHFFPVYRAVLTGFPNDFMGLLPAAFAVFMAVLLAVVARRFPPGHPLRNALLAWFGGGTLFFVTLIFPIQFERQWLTIAWALEGMALLWLFRRVPHPGLRLTGAALLATAFTRLSLNPFVLEYYRRSDTRVFNWYLYTYGIVTVCLFAAGKLLAPPRHLLGRLNLAALHHTLGTVLAFLLLNLEIVDYFSEGPVLRFELSNNLGQNMTYTIAWSVFAFILLLAGMVKRIGAARYASLGLYGVILVKLFFYDLRQLEQLYRIAAFIAVAVILIVASFAYQRFLAAAATPEKIETSK
ncbi:MAG: DUF2339 domain-containing protein [Planctomycetes bacterium]|nr:DUF2339 domain-containing protein [Planctomycetota bacterium]